MAKGVILCVNRIVNRQKLRVDKFMSNKKIHKILFVCHGNICRSPMAEFVMKHMVRQAGLEEQFEIASAATSREEIGNDVYPPVKRLLTAKAVPCKGHSAHQITKAEFEYYDYIIIMDKYNLRNITRVVGEDKNRKISMLRDFTDTPGEIADPWYTGDFDLTYKQVTESCEALLRKLTI